MRNPEVVLLSAALLVVPLALGCTREDARSFQLVRLFEAGRCTLAGPDGPTAAPPPAMTDVAGEARPAIEVACGAVVCCETDLPRGPCWLEVAAARLDAPAVTATASATDATGARLLLDVAMVAGGDRRVLYHALPSPGTKPTALGWAGARIEVTDHLGESVRFEFKLEPPPGDVVPPEQARFALADPRLAPRVDASARGWNLVDWLAPGPSAEELAGPDAAKQWPGHARLLAAATREEVATATPPRAAHRAAVAWAGGRAPALELQAFGCEVADDEGELARRLCDRFARVDPLLPFARDPDDPALKELRRLDPALRADRARALGERTYCLELARPRRAPLCVEITSRRAAAECDAALLRLQEFLAANDLLERTLLLVRTEPPAGAPGGRGLAITRVPRGWRDRAPTELVERFDARAPEFADR